MIKVDAVPWWPSAPECDVRWEEMHGAERERMQNHRQRARRATSPSLPPGWGAGRGDFEE